MLGAFQGRPGARAWRRRALGGRAPAGRRAGARAAPRSPRWRRSRRKPFDPRGRGALGQAAARCRSRAAMTLPDLAQLLPLVGAPRRHRRLRRGDRRAARGRRRHRAGAGVPLHLHRPRLRRAADHAGLPRHLARHHRLHLGPLGPRPRRRRARSTSASCAAGGPGSPSARWSGCWPRGGCAPPR